MLAIRAGTRHKRGRAGAQCPGSLSPGSGTSELLLLLPPPCPGRFGLSPKLGVVPDRLIYWLDKVCNVHLLASNWEIISSLSAPRTPEEAARAWAKAAALVEGRRAARGWEKSCQGIRGVSSLSEGISLPRKGCRTAEHHGFINQRHFHCPFTATQLLRLSLADSSLIHLPGEGGGTCCRALLLPPKPWPAFGATDACVRGSAPVLGRVVRGGKWPPRL